MKKGIIVFILAAIISACASNQSMEGMGGKDLYNMGMDLLEKGDAKESIRYLQAAYELKKDSFGANLGLADAYLKTGQPKKALPHFEYYASEYKEFYALARLVQTYQSLSMYEERDARIEELHKLWNSTTGEKPAGFIRDVFIDKDMKLLAFQEYSPKSPNIIFYRFTYSDNASSSNFISLGSYDSTTEITRELENKPEGWRLYHLDGYCESMHSTYGFYDEKPTYDQVRKAVLDIYAKGGLAC